MEVLNSSLLIGLRAIFENLDTTFLVAKLMTEFGVI